MLTDYEKEQRRSSERQRMREAAKAAFPAYLRTVHGLTDMQISGKKPLRCLNPQHNDSDASMRYYPEDAHLYCFGCHTRYDLPELIAADNGTTISDPETWNILKRWTGETSSFYGGQTAGAAPIIPPQKEDRADQKPQTDYSEYFAECAARRSDPQFLDYIARRGISLETAELFDVGYDPKWIYPGTKRKPTPRIIIPSTRYSYTARYAAFPKPAGEEKVMKVGSLIPLNLSAFKRNATLFIVEGEFDMLSIEECGGTSIALGSTSNVKRFSRLLPALCENRTYPIVIMMDGDTSGRNAAKELSEIFVNLRNTGIIPAFSVKNYAKYPGTSKDPSDILQRSPDQLRTLIESVGFVESIPDRLCRISGYELLPIEAREESEGRYIW